MPLPTTMRGSLIASPHAAGVRRGALRRARVEGRRLSITIAVDGVVASLTSSYVPPEGFGFVK
jgi:hypothetical protein